MRQAAVSLELELSASPKPALALVLFVGPVLYVLGTLLSYSWNDLAPVVSLSPVLFFNLVIGLVGSFQVFTNAFVMTNGGPQNATLFMVLYIYLNGFHLFKMGYAATLSWLLFWIIMIFTYIQFKVSGKWVYYEGKL
jgi:hypothetical protein